MSLTDIRYERRIYMRIRFMAVPLLLLSLLCAACQQGEEKASGPSIAVVDIVRVMRDSEAGKAGIKYLEDLQAGIQKQLDDIQSKLEKDPENEQLQKQLQTVYMNAQQQMGEEQQNVLSQLQNVTKRVMDEFRRAKGYDVLFSAETLSSYDEKLDVTNDLLVEMNKQKVNFVPLSSPADDAAKADEPADGKDAAPAAPAGKKAN